MKKTATIIVLLLVFVTGTAYADVQLGRQLLFQNGEPSLSGIVVAKEQFEAAVQANPVTLPTFRSLLCLECRNLGVFK